MFDGEFLYTIELKSVGTKSMSYEREKTDNGVIHKHQIDTLQKFSTYKNIISGFIFDFRLSNMTYFCYINEFMKMISNINKKSFNETDLLKLCNPITINKRKLRVNYRYDVDAFLQEAKEHNVFL